MPSRRASWKTSSQRRSRTGTKGNGAVGVGNIAVSQYKRQLNPYKPLSSTSARGAHNDSTITRGVSEDDFGASDDLDLGNDDESEFGLDNILSSIVGTKDSGGGAKGPSSGPAAIQNNAGATSAIVDEFVDEKKEGFDVSPTQNNKPVIAQVNFEKEVDQTSDADGGGDDVSMVTEGETIWTDGDATKEHKLNIRIGQGEPAFSSGGFRDATRVGSMPMNGPSFKSGATKSGNSLVDSLLDDFEDNDIGHRGSGHGAAGLGSMPMPMGSPPFQTQPKSGNTLVDSLIEDIQMREDNTDLDLNHSGQDPTVSEEDTVWTDGDATKEHKLNMEIGQGPAFSSGGFEDNTRLEPMPMTGPSFQSGAKKCGNSLVDSLIEDISVSQGSADRDNSGQNAIAPISNNSSKLTPKRERFSTNRNDQIRPSKPDPDSKPRDAPQAAKKKANGQHLPPTKVTTTQKVIVGSQEDESLSAVTDPTETPVIYTYKKPVDDDTVSQITTSVTGSSFGSSHLQNIPTTFGTRSRHRSAMNGPSWMESGQGEGGGMGRSRMINRKGGMVIPGPYGRDRGRRIATKFSSTNHHPGSVRSRGSSNSSSCSGGSAASFDGGKSNLDEIEYALNADCAKGRPRRPTPVGGNGHFVGEVKELGEDLSTVVSSTIGHNYIDTNVKSNVSQLGMGGVSCGAQSVAENTAVTESTSSTLGLVQSLTMFAWKAQHRASRYFFPTSPKVAQRKKFDRADSMDDLVDVLLEEGSGTFPQRKQRGSRHDGGDDEDEIDYFSRAMSASNNLHGGMPRKPKQGKKYFWQGRTSRIGALFLLLTIAFTVFQMPGKKSKDNPASAGEFRAVRVYDAIQRKRDQDEYTRNSVDDNDAHRRRQEEASGVGRLGQRLKDNNIVASDSGPPIELPSAFYALANVDDLFQRGIDVPFYWHVPRSGGGTMNDVLGSCLQLTLAADAGVSEEGGEDETLKVLHFSGHVSYVNVDTSTHEGIDRAKNLDLVSSGLSDVVISPLLHEASSLFTPTRRGRMFTIFRHPVERAASLFYFIQETQWQQPGTRNDQFADITIEKFYKSGFAENNWMTRFLTNELTKDDLTEKDLNIAKEVLRRKCLVGFLEEKGETFERIQKYFGWRPKNEEQQDCFEKKLEWAWPMKHKHPAIEEGSRAWNSIAAANKFDLQLYDFAKELFIQQGEQLFPR
eukprot:CAMPEP_0183713170 /NCGR_PEP_ID=MMETSP0737-20130205/8101_1 /TAXON_ID=385413 /ORGANISM="Thalassiosira miniscula, Strain CCMP1093" /LENGTH=1188 /DNA_ID=CAMNT_0025941921 /DNA_START=135 /DNA_END=3701 /DNA_ORIENTATION=-